MLYLSFLINTGLALSLIKFHQGLIKHLDKPQPFPAPLAAHVLYQSLLAHEGCQSTDCIEVSFPNGNLKWEFVTGQNANVESHFENLCTIFLDKLGDYGEHPFYKELERLCDDDDVAKALALAKRHMPRTESFINQLWNMTSQSVSKPNYDFLDLLFDHDYQTILSQVSSIHGVKKTDKLLGEGGCGKVYERLEEEGLVAVKKIIIPFTDEGAPDLNAIGGIVREIEGLQLVKGDDRFVQLYSVQLENWDTIELVMEYLFGMDGSDLFYHLYEKSQHQLPILNNARMVAAITKQLVQGLHTLHQQKYIHSDMKPENIFFTVDGRLKIIDMGFIYDLRKPRRHTLGYTPAYRPPEGIREWNVGEKYDTWTLGLILMQIITFKLMPRLERRDQYGKEVQKLLKEAERMNTSNQVGLDREIDFVRKCLKVNVHERPSCDALLKHPFLTENVASDQELKLWIQALMAELPFLRSVPKQTVHGHLLKQEAKEIYNVAMVRQKNKEVPINNLIKDFDYWGSLVY